MIRLLCTYALIRMLFADALDLFIQLHLTRLASGRRAAGSCRLHFAPFLTRTVDDITTLEVLTWFTALGNVHPQIANKVLSYLKTMFQFLLSMQVLHGQNPTLAIKRYPCYPRKRFVQPHEEMTRLLASLAIERDAIETYFLTLVTTGCRPREARLMQWSHLHLESGRWDIPLTKTRRPHILMLPPELVTRLQQLSHHGDSVFSGRSGQPWSASTMQRIWTRIRTRAGLPDVQMRDLRRTVASWLEEEGVAITDIGQVLNHASQRTTIWYLAGLKPGRAIQQTLAQHMDRVLAHRSHS